MSRHAEVVTDRMRMALAESAYPDAELVECREAPVFRSNNSGASGIGVVHNSGTTEYRSRLGPRGARQTPLRGRPGSRCPVPSPEKRHRYGGGRRRFEVIARTLIHR
jgi:hypothetical protein